MSFKNKVTTSSIFVYFLIVLVFVTIRMLSAFGCLNFLGEWASYIFNIVVQVGLLLSFSIFIFSNLVKKKAKSVANFYGFRKISPKSVFISIGIGACVFLLNIFIATFFGVIIQIFGYKYTPSTPLTSYPFYMLIVNTFFTAFLPALCEETAHRGMLLKGLSSSGKIKAVIISSILFGLLHMNIEQFFYATIIGFFVGYLAIICDSIYPAMIIHFMNNFLNVYMSFSNVNGLPIGRVYSWFMGLISGNIFLGMLAILLTVFLLIMAIIYLVKKLNKDNRMFALKRLQNEVVKELVHFEYLHEVEQTQFELTGKKKEIEVNEEELMLDKKLGFVSEVDEEILEDKTKDGLSLLSKILLTSTFILLSAVTIFTFVWGAL
jgi:hypothetical protein